MELGKEEIMAIAAGLIAAIVFLFKLLMSWHNAIKADLKNCEVMHKNSNESITELTARVNYLEGKHEGVEALSTKVLERIEELYDRRT